MPVAYYIIPMTSAPYSLINPHRPLYVDEIRCNWTGRNVDALGVYVCKVNTSEAKHTDLASRASVRQLPRAYTWDTVISTMAVNAHNAISGWCNDKGIAYDATETIGELLQRIIATGLFDYGNLSLSTQYQNLTAGQKMKIQNMLTKHGLALPANTETIGQISKRCGKEFWNAPALPVEEY